MYTKNKRLIKGMTAQEVAHKTGLSERAIYHRIRNGWDDDRILSTSAKPEVVTDKGLTVRQLSQMSGLNPSTVYNRIKAGWSEEEILKPLVRKPRKRLSKTLPKRKVKRRDMPSTLATLAEQLSPQARLFCGLAK